MTEPYEPRIPELLDLWRSHDLAFHEDLVVKIKEWHDELDRRDPTIDPEEDPNFDHEASRAKGLTAAKGVKAFLGNDYYVEYRPFREIIIIDGTPVELQVPSSSRI